MKIELKKDYGKAIATETVGSDIYNKIRHSLDSGSCGKIELDFAGIITITTFCAKQIFGRLYTELGGYKYDNTIFIVNASSYVDENIRLGISKRNM